MNSEWLIWTSKFYQPTHLHETPRSLVLPHIVQMCPAVRSSLNDMWTVDRLSLLVPICGWNPFKSAAPLFLGSL